MTVLTIPKPEHGTDEWLALRWHDPVTGLKRISASNAAAVHGEHKYMSQAALAAMLLQPEPPTAGPMTDAQARGHTLEPALIGYLNEQVDHDVTAEHDVMYVAGRLIATIDAKVTSGSRLLGCGEVKTTVELFDGTLPRTWHWQGVQQAICTGTDTIWWAVLDGRLRLSTLVQTVTDDDKAQHTKACEEFLSWIDMGVMPPDCAPTADDIAVIHPQHTADKAVEVDDAVLAAVRELDIARRRIKEWQAKEKTAKDAVAVALGDAEIGTHAGVPVVAWKTQTKASYTVKASTTRVMRVLEKGDQQ